MGSRVNEEVALSDRDSEEEEGEGGEREGEKKVMMMGRPPLPIRDQGWFLSMGVLDIAKEASALLRSNSSVMMSITAFLVFPVAALVLSHAATGAGGGAGLVHRLSHRFEEVAATAGLVQTVSLRSVCTKLSETLVSYTFCLPAFVTLWPIAKASVLFTVACTYSGKRVSPSELVSVVPRLCRRLLITSVWTSTIILCFVAVATLSLLLLVSFLDVLLFSADLVLLAELSLGVLFSVVFAHMMVVCNLATVISVLEEDYSGSAALLRSLFLIKGRTQVALLLLLISGVGTAVIEGLFQYRVLGTPGNRYIEYNSSNWIWEGPLLIFMYSFIYTFDAIMSSVFFYTCKARLNTPSIPLSPCNVGMID